MSELSLRTTLRHTLATFASNFGVAMLSFVNVIVITRSLGAAGRGQFVFLIADDPRIRIDQSWLDRYELEYYVHWKAIKLGYRVVEVGVSKTYPKGGGNYSKIRRVRDWWSIVKPTLLLWLRVRD